MIRQDGYEHLIIGLSGNTLAADVKEFEEAGAGTTISCKNSCLIYLIDIVLSKPLQMATLDVLLKHCIEFGHKKVNE